MKNKKWGFAIVLMMVITVSACAQQYDPESDFKAKPVDGGKGVEITEYVGSKWEVRIPPRIQGLPVTHIGNNAFRRKNLINVTIPNGITHIGGGAFSSNPITSITIPNSVTSIGGSAFEGCGLTSITIPNNVTNIGNYAFYGCTSLTNITIGNNVTSIGDFVFTGCTSLTTINVNAGNNVYTSENGILYNKNKTSLHIYPKGKTSVSFTIPNSVTSISDYAFEDCTSLSSVIIPNTVISIGDNAFYGCTGLNGRFFEVLKPLVAIMSDYESIPAQERRDKYDNILPDALTSQPTIFCIFSMWKPNALDGMDAKNIGRAGSTPRGQYAPVFAKENGVIEKSTFTDVNDSMAYITGPSALKERLKPMRFKVNGQDIWTLRIEFPIIHRTKEVIGVIGCYGDIR